MKTISLTLGLWLQHIVHLCVFIVFLCYALCASVHNAHNGLKYYLDCVVRTSVCTEKIRGRCMMLYQLRMWTLEKLAMIK